MQEKTQAMRTLESKRISFQVLTYPDNMRDAEEIVLVLDLPPEQVFKTLVVLPPEGTRKPILVMVPADKQLDLKKLADGLKVKKVKMATHREAEQLTGLQVGGISAVTLLNKPFLVLIDSSSGNLNDVCISAGKRGFQIKLAVSDLIKLTNAQIIDVTIIFVWIVTIFCWIIFVIRRVVLIPVLWSNVLLLGLFRSHVLLLGGLIRLWLY